MEYVYFFRETGRPYVKIGMSKNDIESRFQAFKTYAPLGAYIVGYIKTNDSTKLEKDLHKKYAEKRLQGEFFNLTDDEVYSEINLHDVKFGEIVYLVDELINFYKYDIKLLKKELQKKLEDLKLKNQKNIPDQFLIDYLKENKGKLMTNSMICNSLKTNNYIIDSYKLGVILKKLGYKQKVKRINSTPQRVYIL